jgi:hypothetical protein
MKRQLAVAAGRSLAWAGVVTLLARATWPWLAILVIALREVSKRRQASDWSLGSLARSSGQWLGTLSFAILIALAPRAVTAYAMGLTLALWLMWLEHDKQQPDSSTNFLMKVGLVQFVGVSAVFVAAAVWRWPIPVVMAAVWMVSFVAANYFLADRSEPARPILAAAWGLVSSQLAWLFSVWMVNYVLLGGHLILPQAAVVLTALGYCFGSIYMAHREGRLSRARLLEYILIGLVILAVVIAGTEWNASI